MQNDLLSIYADLYRTDEINKANVTDLAERLTEAINRRKPYQYKYIDNLLQGRQTTKSAELHRAINVVGGKLDGLPDLQARSRPVTLYSTNGTIDGSFIIGLHTKRCRHCHLPFLGHPSRLYCSDEHGVLYRRKNDKRTTESSTKKTNG